MRKAGAKDYQFYCKKILKVCKNKPVSFGGIWRDDYLSMKKQALKIFTLGKYIFVKIPIVNSRGIFPSKIIKELNKRGIKLNITAVYTANQVSKILKLIDKKTK